MEDLRSFTLFLESYVRLRIFNFGQRFEKLKDIIVAFLIVKRGKYSTSFLNTSIFLLVAAAIIGGPIIAENNPFVNALESVSNGKNQAVVVSYNPTENSLTTVFSVKPRDKVIEHEIKSGETLSSIAQDFDVTVDTIKWANNLKSDTIKPGEKLKIPPVTGVVHKVQSGDNIYSIAKKYNTAAQKIVNFPFNDFADLETFSLMTGQLLYVPDGVIEEEQPKYLQQQLYAQVQAGVHGTSTFLWPATGLITQYPVWYHMALDIANPSSPPILAADTGTVVYSGCIAWGYGCHIIIDHGNGYKSLYAHFSQISVSAGQVVSQGQQLGNMGSTGRSTGTHLHFEIRAGDTLLNPLNFLK